MTRDQVRESQRMRLLEATADVVGEVGYANSSVARIIKMAGVSRETFYEHFRNKEDCYLAAQGTAVRILLGEVAREAVRESGTGSDPLVRLDRLLKIYFNALMSRPLASRAFLVEVYGAGPRAIELRLQLQGRFADAIAALWGISDPSAEPDERFACEALVAAISSLVSSRIGAGEIDQLDSLREPIVSLVERTRLAPAGKKLEAA